jgi:arylsulfatase A
MATLAAVVGATLPANTAHDSYDLLPVWKKNAPSPRRSIVHNTNKGGYAVRHENWLLVAAKTGGITRVPEWFDVENGYEKNEHPGELYDLATDLAQKRNLYGKRPDKVAELTGLLNVIRANGQVR